jgi:serine/threonine-protein kinase
VSGPKPPGASAGPAPAYAPPDVAERRAAIEELFEAALDEPPERRDAWLAARCGDGDLRREVELLLAAHEREDSVLDAPAARVAAVLNDPVRGRHIGPYRVLRELGRGGMGVVYLAERDDGQYRRRVAVKVLRASPHADEMHRRFVAERQILASLSHPNIAQLLDGGVADDLPYLVLEYVDGLPVTAYCDRHRLGVDARLRLFQDVCAAVHHAHQNLVLHRDLKPSNVLVTAGGLAKLLDFGIAKLLNPTLAGPEQPVTRTAFRLMTPEYASPEQVRGDSLTTASDVYALGLLLYELLVGRPAHRIAADSPRAVFEAVCEHEPERPSTGARRDVAAAAARETTPEKLCRRLRGDLDAIVALALRKEPGRRYGSAELLAADVGRHLDGLPVLARRGTRGYRFEKLLHRHRAAAAFAATTALLIVGGAGVALHLAAVAARERDRATAALATTRQALGEAEEVTTFLVGLFEASDPAEGRADTLSAADLLRRGVVRAERLGAAPLAQARMFEALGRVHVSQAELALGAELVRRALAIRRQQLGPGHPATATTASQLADVLIRQGQNAAADTVAREALRIRRRALGDAHPDVASSLQLAATIAVYRGDLAAAEALVREAIAVRERAGRGADSAMADNIGQLASVRWRRGDQVGAERAYREALAVARRAYPGPHRIRTESMLRLADLLAERPAAWPEVEALYRAALAENRALLGDAHPDVAWAMTDFGTLLAANGRAAEGERLIRQALEIRRRAWGPSHPTVAAAMYFLGRLLMRDGYSAEAERLLRDATTLLARSLGTSHGVYASALSSLGDALALRGALDSAEVLQRRALAIRVAESGPEHTSTALTALRLADVLARGRRYVEADSIYRRSLAVVRRHTTDTHKDVRATYAGLASLYEAWGKPDSAAAFRRRANPGAR